jgi:hypothetical protein
MQRWSWSMSADLPTPGAPLMLIVSVPGSAMVDPPDITLKLPLRPIAYARPPIR